MNERHARKLANKVLKFQAAKTQDPLPRPSTRVVLLMPSYKGPHPRTVDSIGKMIQFSRAHGIDFYSAPQTSGSVVHWTRNGMLADLIRQGESFDYALWCDDDMTVEPDYLMRLLEHKKPIVAGICTRRSDPPVPNIRALGKNMRYNIIAKWDTKQRLIEVDGAGTGFMLTSSGALDAIGEYYLRCGYERQTFGRMFNHSVQAEDYDSYDAMERELAVVESGRRDYFRINGNAWWFQFLPSLIQEGEYGEDISFCLKAKLCGIPVFADTTVTPGHVGDYVYTVQDYFDHQDEVVARGKA